MGKGWGLKQMTRHNNTDRPRFIRTALPGNEKRYYDPVTN